MLCIHCHILKANRSRGLCPKCYYDLDIRHSYPYLTDSCNRGVGADNPIGELSAYPTEALPGTEEKVVVMEARAKLGQSLWHPLDKQVEED